MRDNVRTREGLSMTGTPRELVGSKAAAWAVHGLTASGAALAFLSLLALFDGDVRRAWIYLGVAFIVDGVDGALARRFAVKTALPRIEGAALDLVVDYLTYVLVPVAFVYQLGLLPEPLLLPGCLFILVTALYTFANADLKTDDNYFTGFPALWNVAVLHFYLLDLPLAVNAVATLVLGLMTFAPVKTLHPVRVRDWRWVTLTVLVVWSTAIAGLVWTHPDSPAGLEVIMVGGTAYFIGVSLWRTFERSRST